MLTRKSWSTHSGPIVRGLAVSFGMLLYFGAPGYCQTNDHLYRSWRWSTTPATARAVGFSGAYLAVADDAGAAFLNPAGIVTLAKSEVSVSFLSAEAGSAGPDHLGPWSGVAAAAGAARLSRKTALACYFTRPRAGRIQLSNEFRLPDGSSDGGYLDATVTDLGAVAARRLADRLSVGVRVTATHLELEGLQRRRSAGDRLELETGSAAGATRVTASLGVLYEAGASGKMKLGLVVQPGASYTVERTASRPSLGGIDQGSLYELRAPGLLAVGAAYRMSRHVLFSSQLDYVRYSEIEAFVRPGGATAGRYAIPDGLEPRFGVELSLALGSASIQLRGGAHIQAPGSLLYTGPDANEVAAFRGSTRRWLAGAGVSLSLGGLTVDIGGIMGGDRPEVSAGARLRF